jgi:DNA-binding MarR family transcriptional regulator
MDIGPGRGGAERARAREAKGAVREPSPEFVPLDRSVGYHVRQLSDSWTALMDRRAEPHGISLSQWRYLRELWEEDGLSSGELTRRVGRQGPTTVAAVRGLERAGLVRTVKSAHDRRKSYVHLTARGRRLAATMSPLIRDSNDFALAALSPDEVAAFKRFVVRIQRALDAESRNRNSWSAWRTEKLAKEVGL